MIREDRPIIYPPVNDSMIRALGKWVGDISRNTAQIITGEYVGTGVSGQKVSLAIAPIFIYINAKSVGASSAVISLVTPSGVVSHVAGVNVANAVIKAEGLFLTLGNNASVNSPKVSYVFCVFG